MQRTDRAEIDSLIASANDQSASSSAKPGESSSTFIRVVVAVTAVASIFVISWLLLSRGRKTSAKQSRATTPAAATMLDRLIRNKLPIHEEAPAFPASLELLKEASPPAGRIEPVQLAQPVLRPHFQPRVAPVAASASAISERPVPAAEPVNQTTIAVHDQHSVPPPTRRTMNRLKSSDALGRALSALRETSAQEG